MFVILRLLVFPLENEGNFIAILAGIIGTTALIITSCLFGSYLSQAIKRLPELIPVCSVAFMVDIYSVFKGPSKEIALQIGKFYGDGAKGRVPFADILLLKIPNPSVEYLIPVFGVSDWIFIVFLSSVMLKFKISDSIIGKDLKDVVDFPKVQLYFPLVSFGLLVSILTAYLLNSFVPALPIILIIVLPWLIFNNRTLFKMRRNECFLTLIPLVFVCIFFFYS